MPEWLPAEGTAREDEMIVLHSCSVARASRMCCPEHGITQVALFEFVGEIQGIMLAGTIEMTLNTAKNVGQALLEVRER